MKFTSIQTILFATTAWASSGGFYVEDNGKYEPLHKVMADGQEIVAVGSISDESYPTLHLESGEVSYKNENDDILFFGKMGRHYFSFATSDAVTPFILELNPQNKILNLEVQTCGCDYHRIREVETRSAYNDPACAAKSVYFLHPDEAAKRSSERQKRQISGQMFSDNGLSMHDNGHSMHDNGHSKHDNGHSKHENGHSMGKPLHMDNDDTMCTNCKKAAPRMPN